MPLSLGEMMDLIVQRDVFEESERRGVSLEQVKKERAEKAELARLESIKRETEFRRSEKEALDALNENSGLPFRFHVGVAYHPRQGPNMHGGRHLVLDESFSRGRLTRRTGNALCSPKDFWGLEPTSVAGAKKLEDAVRCPKCLEAASRIRKNSGG